MTKLTETMSLTYADLHRVFTQLAEDLGAEADHERQNDVSSALRAVSWRLQSVLDLEEEETRLRAELD